MKSGDYIDVLPKAIEDKDLRINRIRSIYYDLFRFR